MSNAGRPRLAGEVAFITGGARGMGEACARRFVEEGARVVIGDIRQEQGRALAAELGSAAVFVELDVTDEANWQSAWKAGQDAFGPIGVLVNNAGINYGAPIVDTPLAAYQRVVMVNQTGVFLGMREAIPGMIELGGGAIVNVCSIAGVMGVNMMIAYTASKFAVTGMTKAAGIELAKYKIRVNSIHPGATNTPMMEEAVAGGADPAALTVDTPLGRLGTPLEIANLALYLASGESTYCTGAQFVVDGGNSAGSYSGVGHDGVLDLAEA